MDLFRRASHLNDALWHISTKYTYEIIGRREPEKVMARVKIGEMEAEILGHVVDDLTRAGVRRYLEYLGWDNDEVAAILKGKENAKS